MSAQEALGCDAGPRAGCDTWRILVNMNNPVLAISVALMLSGCVSPVTYEPGCVAMAGDRIEVTGARFVWDKFTDVRRIDEDGNEIEAYPDYPKSGRVESSGSQLKFIDDSGNLVGELVGYSDGANRFLLTAAQHDKVQAGADVPACALKLMP
ncbi:MAG: hypothetical protein AAGL69_14655 [Pseudomonadota bacterium]